MTPNQAKQEALRLAKEGKDQATIAQHLKEAGYIGRKGTPLTKSAVSYMLLRAGFSVKQGGRIKKASTVEASTKKGGKDRLEALRSILNLKMDAEEKVALALLILG